MSDRSSIEWTDATWNPVTGCTEVSPGCDHCYAKTFAERFRGVPGHHFENGFDVQLRPDKLDQPLKWKRGRRIFVNSMSDLFHDDIPDEYIAKVFAIMARTPQHTYQVLTKRHARMRSMMNRGRLPDLVVAELGGALGAWPPQNVWLGVSVENQQWADIRVPALMDTPAAVRFLSCEPLLGPVSLFANSRIDASGKLPDWIIVGGESGRGARPINPEWVRGLRSECGRHDIAFHFKQWGEYAPIDRRRAREGDVWVLGEGAHPPVPWRPDTAGAEAHRWGPYADAVMRRVGKKAAGRELDGRTWDEYPAAADAASDGGAK